MVERGGRKFFAHDHNDDGPMGGVSGRAVGESKHAVDDYLW